MSDNGFGIATAAPSGGTVTVNVGGTVTTMNAPRDLTVAAGDPVVFVQVGSKWYVLQRYATAAVGDQPINSTPPTPKPATVTGSRTFTPVETRSYKATAWRTDNDHIYQGEFGATGNHTGCAFYGTGPRSLSGATVTSATIMVRRRRTGGLTAAQSTTLRLVGELTRPSGAPTLSSTTAGPSLAWGASATFTVPTAWAQSMVDGTNGGLAIFEADGDPYVILSGRSEFSASFALTINYTRTL